METNDIGQLGIEELTAFMEEQGEKAFRARQVWEWLWGKGVRSFDEMTSLSKPQREMLQKHFHIHSCEEADRQTSTDRTIKTLFRLHDGALVESVLIPSRERATACISPQSGCALNCAFCATGQRGSGRDLSVMEISDQAMLLDRQAREVYGNKLTNIVIMGMGEPLLNFENVSEMIHRYTDPKGQGWAPSRITLSTAGLPGQIVRLGREHPRVNLAISLHTANDKKRSELMPINKKHGLDSLASALVKYHEITGNRITMEYLMMRDVNDRQADASELAGYCKQFPVKINLINYNATADKRFQPTSDERVEAFADFLKGLNMVVNIRRSRGQDIAAACGQLAARNN